MPISTHTYTNGEVTVVWQPALCIHSRRCFNGLPAVFDPGKRPWITPEGATSEAIVAQVKQCPSGALSIKEAAPADAPDAADIAAPSPEETPAAKADEAKAEDAGLWIDVTLNGPLLVHGNIAVQDGQGNRTHKGPITALCRCGYSSNKPYCDGSHTKAGFVG